MYVILVDELLNKSLRLTDYKHFCHMSSLVPIVVAKQPKLYSVCTALENIHYAIYKSSEPEMPQFIGNFSHETNLVYWLVMHWHFQHKQFVPLWL